MPDCAGRAARRTSACHPVGRILRVLMTAVDYAPILSRKADGSWFSGDGHERRRMARLRGIYVGPTEEILFRSLLVGFLIAAMPGTLRIGRYAMKLGRCNRRGDLRVRACRELRCPAVLCGVRSAALRLALGVLMPTGSKIQSVVAPIVAQCQRLTEYAICFALIALWR